MSFLCANKFGCVLAAPGCRETCWVAEWSDAVVAADTPKTCSSCAHYDANSSATEGVGYCTNPVGWHRAKPLPPHEMCSKWAARTDDE